MCINETGHDTCRHISPTDQIRLNFVVDFSQGTRSVSLIYVYEKSYISSSKEGMLRIDNILAK